MFLSVSLAARAAYAQDCTNWNPNLGVAPQLGAESAAFTATWSVAALPAACDNDGEEESWPGTSWLRLVRKVGADATINNPSDGTVVATMSTATATRNDFVHRSMKYFTYRLFACTTAYCTR